jgi:glycine cleavage system H protein
MADDLIAQLPTDRLYAAEQDMWVKLEPDGTALVGAVHVVASHGQFMMFTPRSDGTEVARDRSLGVMETAKSAVAIHAPISCRIVAANPAVVADVNVAARDPYGAGWLLRVTPTAWDVELTALMEASTYAAWLAPRLAEKLTGPLDERGGGDIDPMRTW